MLPIRETFKSTLGLKFLTAITGIGLVIFIIFHFLANISLFNPNPNSFNELSNTLEDFGGWLLLVEVILLALVGVHILVGVYLKYVSMRARPQNYRYLITKNGPSKKGFASTQLLITGIVILIFLIIHVIQFKFGPNISDGYVVSIQGKQIRDVHRVVAETFRNNYWSAFYVLSVILLGFHLRHGIWSLFQSLGATNSRSSGVIYYIGSGLALIITIGFALMPVFFLFGDVP